MRNDWKRQVEDGVKVTGHGISAEIEEHGPGGEEQGAHRPEDGISPYRDRGAKYYQPADPNPSSGPV
ncbi:uncharacterized protein PG986_012189 [Apiospora aurea]|uniref:Uncharacterized protein n=1 Tax=Apiospora aurea TaxID=335848 RepID=A0ABR1PZA6_9PEZI